MTIAKTTTSTDKDKQEKKVEAEFFHIDMIPDAMEKMGWEMAPKLMRHWFSISPAYKFNDASKTDILEADARKIDRLRVSDDIIKMAWAIKFEQVSDGMKKLISSWNSVNGRRLLKERLAALGDYDNQCIALGYSQNVRELDATAQVNFTRIGRKTDTLNDWYGAMGNCNLKVCLKGSTSTYNGRSTFTVDGLGFYLKDTYDFLDDRKNDIDIPEFLGVWSGKNILTKLETSLYISSYASGVWGYLARNFSGYVPVFNSDFRAWQERHNKGGDYMVFSDVLWLSPLEKDREVEL